MSAIISQHFKAPTALVDNDRNGAGRKDGQHMKKRVIYLLLLAPLSFGLTGCISSSNPPPPPPSSTTVVVPSGTTVICSNGTQPPCQ